VACRIFRTKYTCCSRTSSSEKSYKINIQNLSNKIHMLKYVEQTLLKKLSNREAHLWTDRPCDPWDIRWSFGGWPSCPSRTAVKHGVARFFLVQTYQNGEKYTKWRQTIPNDHKIYQMAVNYSKRSLNRYTNIFHSKALQNLPKLGFLVWKQTIWQP
jgi:hypothetical protein